MQTHNYFLMSDLLQQKILFIIFLKCFHWRFYPVTLNKLNCEWKRRSWLLWLLGWTSLLSLVPLFTESGEKHVVFWPLKSLNFYKLFLLESNSGLFSEDLISQNLIRSLSDYFAVHLLVTRFYCLVN